MLLSTIYPYLLRNTWAFDDAQTGLKEEAFVLGMSEMIARLVAVKGLVDAARGFKLQFSAEPFDGADAELSWLRSGNPDVVPGAQGSASQAFGNWYVGNIAGQEMEGWLCPALGLYFNTAPARVFVKADPLPVGVDPIWHIDRDDPSAVRFVAVPGE